MTRNLRPKHAIRSIIFILIALPGTLSACSAISETSISTVGVNYDLTPTKKDPATQELTLVPLTEIPTLNLTPEPTLIQTLEPTVAETQVIELENTICSECLLPRAIQKDYEGVYEGITVKFSFAIDKTMLKHFPGNIVDFDLNIKEYPELPELIALNTLEIHYLGWKFDNPNSSSDFVDYIEMVKNGGGLYYVIASVDDLSIIKSKRTEFKYVTIDPKKRVTYIESMEPNLLSSGEITTWPVQTVSGDFEFRRTGKFITSKNQILIDYPEHSLGRLWMFNYLSSALGYLISADDIDLAKTGIYPFFGMSPEIIQEHNKIVIDFFSNERGKISSPPYFNIDFRK